MRLGLAGAISGPGLALPAGVMAPPHDNVEHRERFRSKTVHVYLKIQYYKLSDIGYINDRANNDETLGNIFSCYH
jgi:hypothetical protein